MSDFSSLWEHFSRTQAEFDRRFRTEADSRAGARRSQGPSITERHCHLGTALWSAHRSSSPSPAAKVTSLLVNPEKRSWIGDFAISGR